MKRDVWIRRFSALGVAVCLLLAVSAATGVVADVLAVKAAEAQLALAATPATAASDKAWVRPTPLLRLPAGNGTALVGETLNPRLTDLGLAVTQLSVASVKPLGDGLRLAEVRVAGTGDSEVGRALAEWVAVNREALRLQTLSITPAQAAGARLEFTLLVVIA
jgi:hypothetical protein